MAGRTRRRRRAGVERPAADSPVGQVDGQTDGRRTADSSVSITGRASFGGVALLLEVDSNISLRLPDSDL